MTVISSVLFDAEADGDFSPSAPWSVVGVAPVVGSASLCHGSKGCGWSATDVAGRIQYDTGANQDVLVLSFYVRPVTFASVHQYLAAMLDLPSGSTLQGDVRINVARTVSIRNGFTAVATSTLALSTGTYYRFEWMIDTVANLQELRVYEDEEAVPYFILNGAWSSDTCRVPSFGPNVAAADGAVDYDTLRVADDWTGSYVNPPLPTPVLTIATTNPTVANDDGEIEISWPAVAGAESYTAGIAVGHSQTSGFTETPEVTSPFSFTGLAGGDYTVALKAIAPVA